MWRGEERGELGFLVLGGMFWMEDEREGFSSSCHPNKP